MDDFWSGRRVFITGHTGFKGSWLGLWLTTLGARVTGYALAPPTEPALFRQLALADQLTGHHQADIRDAETLATAVTAAAPEIILHLAAQPLVRRSYVAPLETWQTNVMGSLHLLEAARRLPEPCTVIMVTTDKVYDNREWLYAYRENDPLGGHDPYSASKAACELAVESWRRSFCAGEESRLAVASVRAGNVVGGGDWAEDRLVPDCMRALARGAPVPIRNPLARRPWQHVLDPLNGYLLLARTLHQRLLAGDRAGVAALATAVNFGPEVSANRTVRDLVAEVFRHWPGEIRDAADGTAPHEARDLNLATEKAFHLLGWRPRWDFARTLAETVAWYRAVPAQADSATARAVTLEQMERFGPPCTPGRPGP